MAKEGIKTYNGEVMKRESVIVGLIVSLFIFSIILSLQFQPFQFQQNTSSYPLRMSKGIGVIEINGPIAFEMKTTSFSSQGASAILDQIDAMKDDLAVKGILLRINSPGGTVGASQEIYTALLALKKEREIPIVASIADVGASGAYYAALAADTIYANPGSLVGSIGVIIGNINYTELAKKHGVHFNVYKSGPYKDILSGWRPSTAVEDQLLNQLIQDVYLQFVSAVTTQRHLSPNVAKALAQGQIYTGKMAQKNKLIDQLGGYNSALAAVAKAAGITGKPIIIKKDKYGFSDFLSGWKDQLGVNWHSLFFPAITMTY